MRENISALTLVAAGMLAGCSNQAPATFTPATGSNQARPMATSMSHKHGGRVLYVGDIDGQPGVGQILVYTAGMGDPQLIRTITNGTGRPLGLFVDSRNYLYVANFPNKYPASVTEFKPGASSPFFQITNFKGNPSVVAVDAHHNVFVNESYQDDGIVQEFAPGSNTAERTIDTGDSGYAFAPGGMAFDPMGNLMVAEVAKLQVQLFEVAPGSSVATPLGLDVNGHNLNGPGIGIDKAGNIYVASSQGQAIGVFPPGQTEPSRIISSVPAYGMTAVTPQGAIYQASGEGSVAEVAPGESSPTYTLKCQCSAQSVAVSR
ncbi:MAG: hypothetical protein WA814_13860 [Candidatus Baltobacteraceae bacterium]